MNCKNYLVALLSLQSFFYAFANAQALPTASPNIVGISAEKATQLRNELNSRAKCAAGRHPGSCASPSSNRRWDSRGFRVASTSFSSLPALSSCDDCRKAAQRHSKSAQHGRFPTKWWPPYVRQNAPPYLALAASSLIGGLRLYSHRSQTASILRERHSRTPHPYHCCFAADRNGKP